MTFDPDRTITIMIKTNHPNLLEGLDNWLRLGLVDESQIFRISRQYLTCRCPDPIIEPIASSSAPKSLFLTRPSVVISPPVVQESWFVKWLQSLKDELSVRWLLFLGVFLVLLSSGVLAGSQWGKFPPVGQYGILFSYTLVFWGVFSWTKKQESLKLTSQTLQTIALLLIPVNFWSIDSFSLTKNILGLLVAVICSLTLFILFVKEFYEKKYPFPFVNFLGLSVCHWGWQIDNLSFMSVYFGMILTAIIYKLKRHEFSQSKLKIGYVIYGLVLLLIRAVFVVQLPIKEFGLALGICGWLWGSEQLSQSQENQDKSEFTEILQRLGLILMGIGWLLCLPDSSPWRYSLLWQALVISGLGLSLFWQRLTIYWSKWDLFFLYGISLETLIIVRNLIPTGFRKVVVNKAVDVVQAYNFPLSIYGVALFPVIIIFTGLGIWFYQVKKDELGKTTDGLNLFFGILLLGLALWNPAIRSTHLCLSTITLVYYSTKRPIVNSSFIALTHGFLLLMLASIIEWQFPKLDSSYWIYLILLTMVIQWIISLIPTSFSYYQLWTKVTYSYGLVLAGIAYLMIFREGEYLDIWKHELSTIWLLTPVGLTLMSEVKFNPRRVNCGQWSLVALCCSKILTINSTESIAIDFLITAILLFFNTEIVTSFKNDKRLLIYLNHICILVALSHFMKWFIPNLAVSYWLLFFLTITVIEWGITILMLPHSEDIRGKLWQNSCWYYGLGCAGYSYFETLTLNSNLVKEHFWFGIIPLCLTILGYVKHFTKQKSAIEISTVSLILLNTITWGYPSLKLMGLILAMILMGFNIYCVSKQWLAYIHVGFLVTLSYEYLLKTHTFSEVFIMTTMMIVIFAVVQDILQSFSAPIWQLYQVAFRRWALGLSYGLLLLGSLGAIGIHYVVPGDTESLFYGTTVLSLTILYRDRRNLKDSTFLLSGLFLELSLISGVTVLGGKVLDIAIVNVCFSVVLMGLISLLGKHYSVVSYSKVLKSLPLLYAGIGFLERWGYFTPVTGFLTIGIALTGLGVGRYFSHNKVLSYFSLLLMTVGGYELAIYQLSSGYGESVSDTVTILALVAGIIALVDRLLVVIWEKKGGKPTFNFTLNGILSWSHCHWALASFLNLFALAIAHNYTPQHKILSLSVSLILSFYALIQGRQKQSKNYSSNQDWWVYLGISQLLGTIIYARFIYQQLAIFDPFTIIIFSLISLFIYYLPWTDLGWNKYPWERSSLIIPALTVMVTQNNISNLNLWAVAFFYGQIAWETKNIRWTYLTLGFIDWILLRFLDNIMYRESLYFAFIIGGTILYIAQFDRVFKQKNNRNLRHMLRQLGTGIITLIAMINYQDRALIPAGISLGFILLGLASKIRSFLYIGTITFLLTGVYQLVVLIKENSLSKWFIGLMAGVLLLVLGFNFEKRREYLINVLQSWYDQLAEWE